MKIDFILPSLSGGGAERVVSVLANYLNSKGYSVNVITFHGGDKYGLDPGVNRVKLHRNKWTSSIIINALVELFLYYRYKKNRPSVVSLHNSYLAITCIPVFLLYGLKFIVSEHLYHKSYKSKRIKWSWRYLYPLAEKITVLTSRDQSFYEKKLNQVMVMPNPCPFEPLVMVPKTRGKENRMLAIGDLNRYQSKGFDNLIKIVTPLFDKYPNWSLIIAGEGAKGKTELKECIERSNLSSRIHLMGFESDLPRLFSESDIFVLASQYEGLPMALIEAMSQGVACVAYDCETGPSEIIDHEINGLLVENQNQKAMAESLERLMDNEELRNIYGKQAPKAIAHKYSKDVIGKKWEILLQEVVQNPVPG